MSTQTGINKTLAAELLGTISRDPSEVSRLSMKKYDERKETEEKVREECCNTSSSDSDFTPNNTSNNSSSDNSRSIINSLFTAPQLRRIEREFVGKSQISGGNPRKVQFATIEDLRRDRMLRAAPILEMLKLGFHK